MGEGGRARYRTTESPKRARTKRQEVEERGIDGNREEREEERQEDERRMDGAMETEGGNEKQKRDMR